VDDEPLAQDLIEKFIIRLPNLILKAKYSNALEAMEGITKAKVDVIFLDVNMPEMTGIEFLNSLIGHRPHVILTSASPNYAHEGFEHDVIDYLLKPIAFSRFVRAINKVRERVQPELEPVKEIETTPSPVDNLVVPSGEIELDHTQEKFFMIKVDKKLMRINIDEIIFVEGMKDYVKIHLQNNFIITHITMTKIEKLLLPSNFIRINRSFLVKVKCIKSIEGNMIETTNSKKLAIGFNYREVIRELAKSWMIKQ
jgi:DNA-binding LytR/AlgR family response regulator